MDRFKRYAAAGVLLSALYVEMAARFGIPIVMIGGMLKPDNCTRGTPLCWSESTKANVIGSFFYGLAGQFFVVCLVKWFNKFTASFRIWLVLCIISQFLYPSLATTSPILLMIIQVIRGFGTGVSVAYHLEFLNRWLPKCEQNTYISIVGMVNFLGNGTAGLLASWINDTYGWKFYFYSGGVMFVVVLILHVLFLALWPKDTLFEKLLLIGESDKMEDIGHVEENKVSIEAFDAEIKPADKITPDDIELESKCGEAKTEPATESPPLPDNNSQTFSLRDILSRSYTWVFSLYALSWVLCLYNTLNTAPFYLSNVLGIDASTISILNFALCMTIVVFTIIYSFLGQKLDRYLPWLTCRLTFSVVPMIIQVVVFAAFPHIQTFRGAIVLLVVSTIASASLFSCSVVSANIEMDPANASVIQAFFNGIGQSSGFLGPVFMAYFTKDDPASTAGWAKFFYTLSGFAVLAICGIVASVVFRRVEWQNRSQSGKPYKTN